MKKYKISKDFLMNQYIQQENTISEIARKRNCCSWVIRNRLIGFNIKRRTTGEVLSKKYKGENNPFWKNRINNLPKCLNCNKKLSSYKSKYCNNCKFKILGSPNWKDGISFESYPLGWNKAYKERIRKRDNYTCQKCGKPETECNRKLDVHHIDYDKQNIKPDNLISLCSSCHMKTNGNRKHWEIYFMNKIIKQNKIKEIL